jgi:CheY-like chemotaxis protein
MQSDADLRLVRLAKRFAADSLYLTSGNRSGKPDSVRGAPPRDGAEKRACVLIIDDEPDALDAVAELLEDEGLKTLRARHGGEALDLLRAGERPSLILLDVKMPVMDGREFLRRVSVEPEFAEIPIAIVTASASVRDVPFRKNDAGFFRKPLDYDRLMKVVRSYCR